MINFNTKTLKENPTYILKKNLFSVEECENIKKLYSIYAANGLNTSQTAGGINISKRNSENFWIPFEERWIYERIAEGLKVSNPWEVDVNGFGEMIQLTRYIEGGGYGWHQDFGADLMSLRKISCVVNLSDPKEFEGEGLEIFGVLRDEEMHKQGTAVYFRSFEQHRVNPVYKGQRFSLVSWISGPPWK